MTTPHPTPARTLQCMEIWGGSRATDRAITTPGLDVWVYSRPHEEATHGGDVYYASLCGGGTITRLILADICGHGASVADLAHSLRGLMRRNINRRNQARLVAALNREFGALAKMNRFATAVVATYLTDNDTLTVSNAGHPRPLWRSAATGAWSVLKPDGPASAALEDLPLGIVAEMAYTRHEIVLRPGDLLLLYTDALTEGESPDGVQLGEEGLLAVVAALDATDPATVPEALVAALDAYRGGRAVDDDATFILLHHNAAPGRRPGFRENLAIYAKMLGLRSV